MQFTPLTSVVIVVLCVCNIIFIVFNTLFRFGKMSQHGKSSVTCGLGASQQKVQQLIDDVIVCENIWIL